MNILKEKYHDFTFNDEFPDLFHIILYESGGDFGCYSKLLGYENYNDFVNDFTELNSDIDFVNKFKPIKVE